MPDDDQAQESKSNESSEDSQSTEESQETKGKEQSENSNGEQGETKSKLYKTPDGRELTADQIHEEYGKMVPEFTRRSQKLKDFEKAEEEAKSGAGQRAREAAAGDDVLKDIDPAVRQVILQVAEPIIQKAIGGLKEETTQQEQDKAFVTELNSLETKYPGGDGRPKFDRSKVISRMKEPDNRDFNPETVYEKLNSKELVDFNVKQALKNQKGGSQLETTGGDKESGKPTGKSPKTFADANKAARSRF